MKFWEGAILVVGGIVLVKYMTGRSAAMSSLPVVGVTNSSNLTTQTNLAGGQPTVWGEPLEPAVPPIIPPGAMPVNPIYIAPSAPHMFPIPIRVGAGASPQPPYSSRPQPVVSSGLQPVGINQYPNRPMSVHLM